MIRRICFVCLGNICRSPTAEAIFQNYVDQKGLSSQFTIDSCGTGNYHIGELADSRTRAEAKKRGIDITHRARQLRAEDFRDFDLLLVMDDSNLKNVLTLARTDEDRAKVKKFRSFDATSTPNENVPDPWYEGGFDRVFDICDRAATGLLEHCLKT